MCRVISQVLLYSKIKKSLVTTYMLIIGYYLNITASKRHKGRYRQKKYLQFTLQISSGACKVSNYKLWN